MATEFSIAHWTGKVSEPTLVQVEKPKVPVVRPVVPEPVVPTVDAASLFATIKLPEPEIPPISSKPVLPPIDDELPPLYPKPVEQDALSRTTDPLAATVAETPATEAPQPEAGKAGRGRRAYRSGRGT